MLKPLTILAFVLSSFVALWGGITLASQQGSDGSAAAGTTYPVDLNVQSDICLHDQFIFRSPTGQPLSHNLTLQVVTQPPNNISIFGPQGSAWVDVHGTMGAGSFEAQGQGTVAGFSNTQVTFAGTITGGVLTGKYTFGNTNPPGQGGLPPCGPAGAQVPHPAIYSVKPKPTPTATPKLYSIIVIKLNDDTLQPVPDWRMNLYPGSQCTGTRIATALTDADGMVDFLNLDPGIYSVAEKSQTGWNPVGPTCQAATVPGAAGAVIPPCPIQPDADFPQPGCDSFGSAARVNVRYNQTGVVIGASLGGPVLIRRNNKPFDKDGDGLDEVNTEIVFMELTGNGVTVRESPSRSSTGKIEEQVNITSGVMDFPANSFFDVFFEVAVGGVTLHNNTPFRLACKIDQVPPYKCFYEPPIKTPIDLLDDNGMKIAKLLHGLHLPIPPNETVIIFTNRPKFTPTVTPTPTTTQTPAVTPTPTRTRTPTPTGPAPNPTNPPPNGACTKTAQHVTLQNKFWDQWKCIPNPPNTHFNRIDIFVGSAQQDAVLSAVHFVCQTTNQKVVGVLKAHKKDVNPGTTLPNDEVWSGTFDPKCVEGVNVYVQPVSAAVAVHPVILQVAFTDTQTPTPTPPGPHPTNPPPNGACTKVAQGVPQEGALRDQWKCTQTPPVTPFNRIDIFVGNPSPAAQKLAAVHFECQSTGEKVDGIFKALKLNVNPGTQFPNEEVWSGTFDPKCVEGVNVYVQPVSAAVHPVILQVAFTDTQPPTVTPTHPPTATPTATPRPRNGDANKDGTTNPLDALLDLQYSAGLIPSINPSSDVNGDGITNPLDAALTLQFSAGLLNMLPV